MARASIACCVGLCLLGVAHAQADVAAGAEAEKSAKTIELLLQLQSPASAPGRADSGSYRQSSKSSEGLTPAERKPLAEPDEAARSELAEIDRRPMTSRNDAVDAMVRQTRSPDAGMRKAESDPEAGEMLPFQVFRFLRENRELAIGGAVALLVVAGVAGVAAGAGGRKR